MKAIELSHEEELFDGELNALTYYMLVLQRTGSPQSEINRYAGKADSILPQVKSVMTLINYYQILFVIRQDGKQYREVIAIADKLLSLDGIKTILSFCTIFIIICIRRIRMYMIMKMLIRP